MWIRVTEIDEITDLWHRGMPNVRYSTIKSRYKLCLNLYAIFKNGHNRDWLEILTQFLVWEQTGEVDTHVADASWCHIESLHTQVHLTIALLKHSRHFGVDIDIGCKMILKNLSQMKHVCVCVCMANDSVDWTEDTHWLRCCIVPWQTFSASWSGPLPCRYLPWTHVARTNQFRPQPFLWRCSTW